MSAHDESFAQLIAAMQAQTQAINRLAQSNEALVQAMIDSEGMPSDEGQSTAYLSGAPVR